MDRWKNRIVLITGASSGIGATICKLLSQNGMKVVGCARRIEILEEMKQEEHVFKGFICNCFLVWPPDKVPNIFCS